MNTDGCAIDGNGDLYGLGVRIGVYCQWVSSWIRMLVDEESIEDVHGVNAIFVFAVIIATILAQVHRDVKPIELYIMLQISLGFFITVLSTIGVRNHFLRPKRVKLIWHHYQKVVEKRRQNAEMGEKIWSRHRFKQIFKEERERNNVVKAFYQSLFRMGREYLEDAAAKQYLSNPTFEVPIEYLTPFKPRNISWVGVVWRTAILGVVAGFNVYFWFYIANQPNADDVFLSILWFILSIELTLGWNHVQDINEIKTTGQLIPFIIGCVSTCQVLKQVALIGLRKMFPDWASYELEAAYTARGGIKFHINHSPRDDEGISTSSETRMATGIAFRDVGYVESGQKP
ncbi:hypothetical protein COL26b_012836 [Colletotrichum chrysophilum]|uniref:uncharacterized protein n=1 Tax=Colletotrichum chrysophilum TaxID=1836956 RepID=UPI002301D4CF|nr:uncharacterized protein COL26b_012836 [Colletotrichum chrysophilum]KAJ0340689.1 hypothetical protein KNSL1_011441 [Colletotrichum chrysophilum]KAJ0363718.1 hypothetical protein COL26b_012836 [Colletotrichum chrysophilum]